MSETPQPNTNQPSQDFDPDAWEPLPEDSPIFNGVLMFSPSLPTTSSPPSDPEQPEAIAGNDEDEG